MNRCPKCKKAFRYKGEFCSDKCKNKRQGIHPHYESTAEEHKMWKTFWKCKFQGFVPPEDSDAYQKAYKLLYIEEKYSTKYYATNPFQSTE